MAAASLDGLSAIIRHDIDAENDFVEAHVHGKTRLLVGLEEETTSWMPSDTLLNAVEDVCMLLAPKGDRGWKIVPVHDQDKPIVNVYVSCDDRTVSRPAVAEALVSGRWKARVGHGSDAVISSYRSLSSLIVEMYKLEQASALTPCTDIGRLSFPTFSSYVWVGDRFLSDGSPKRPIEERITPGLATRNKNAIRIAARRLESLSLGSPTIKQPHVIGYTYTSPTATGVFGLHLETKIYFVDKGSKLLCSFSVEDLFEQLVHTP